MSVAAECRPVNLNFSTGIFFAFMPSAIEYVVRGDETEEEIAEEMGLLKKNPKPGRPQR